MWNPPARAVPAVVGPRMGRDSAGDDDRGVVHRARWRLRRLRRSIESSRVESSIGSGRSRSFDRRITESKEESNRSIESRSFVVDDDDDGDAR